MNRPRNFAVRPLPPVLHRVGWASNPLALRPISTITPETMIGRFDDLNCDCYRTFYASATPEGALREKLLALRPDQAAFDRLAAMRLSGEERASLASLRVVPKSFLREFVLTTIEVLEPSDVVDVTASASFDAYLDHTDQRLTVDRILDTSCTLASRRMGAKIWQLNYPGVVYPSRHGADLINYALFETAYRTDELRVPVRQLDIQPLDEKCAALKAVAADLGMTLEFPASYDTRSLWVQSLRDALCRVGEVEWYERPRERGVHYYSIRVTGMKVSVFTFAANIAVEVDAITLSGGAHVVASTSDDVRDVLAALAKQDASIADVLAAALAV